jgi:glycerophosphoryl diester phosphodiesterase
MPVRKRLTTVVALFVTATTALSSDAAIAQPEATLEGRAVQPADTFAEGPSSGAVLDEETKGGRMPPFEGQPVGGVSAVLDEGGGKYLAMADNGFGQKANSADFLLRAYCVRPDFETA